MADLLFRVKGFRIKDCVIEGSQVGKKTAVILMTFESTTHSKGWATDIYPPLVDGAALYMSCPT
jgi:hypothetical protein